MINYEIEIEKILNQDCPETYGLNQGVTNNECEGGKSCKECWYKALVMNIRGETTWKE